MKKALNKKVLSVLIAAVILLVTAFPVLAADPFKLTSSAEAKDSVVTVKIYLPQNTELGTLSFTLKYDTKLLTYVSAEYSSGDVSATNSSTAGEVKINAVWKNTAPLGGEVATITFKVNDGATGKTDFPINVDFSTDANNQHIDLSAVSSSVDLSEAASVPAATDETVSPEGKTVKVDIDQHRQKMGMVFQQFNLFCRFVRCRGCCCGYGKTQEKIKNNDESGAVAMCLQLLFYAI